jgi:hypothetical protein
LKVTRSALKQAIDLMLQSIGHFQAIPSIEMKIEKLWEIKTIFPYLFQFSSQLLPRVKVLEREFDLPCETRSKSLSYSLAPRIK